MEEKILQAMKQSQISAIKMCKEIEKDFDFKYPPESVILIANNLFKYYSLKKFILSESDRQKLKEKMSIMMKELWKTEEYRKDKMQKMQKRYEYMRTRLPEEHPLYGKKVKKETIEKRNKTMNERFTKEQRKYFSSLGMKGKTSYKKGKTLEEIYDKEKAEKIRLVLLKNRLEQILPKKDTSIEVKIQNFLKELNIKYLTHKYIKEIEHGYQCDIFIPSMNMIIECDGDYWHKYPIGREIDHIRTKELIEKGFKVLRLWENKINGLGVDNFKKILMEVNK